MDGVNGCTGVSRFSCGRPLVGIVVVVLVCDGGARADDAVALGRLSTISPACEGVLPEIMGFQSSGLSSQ